ncbi:uncharacterized protein LOC144662351 [Oculina patagonica]
MAVSYFYFLLIIVVLFIPRGDCLSCYKCTSQDSWKDCNSNMAKTECPSGSSQCVTGTLTCTADDVTKTVYYKRCSDPKKSSCDTAIGDMPGCPKSTSFTWSVSNSEGCCSGDNCNSGSSHSINKAMLGICMALTLWALAVMH